MRILARTARISDQRRPPMPSILVIVLAGRAAVVLLLVAADILALPLVAGRAAKLEAKLNADRRSLRIARLRIDPPVGRPDLAFGDFQYAEANVRVRCDLSLDDH